MSYRITEHTADLGIEATGVDAGECLSEAGRALACIVTGRDEVRDIRPAGELAFEVEAPDREALAVAFLSEVLWFLESESTLWLGGGVEVEQEGAEWRARAQGNSVVYDAGVHGQGTEVKAVTYHGLAFGQDGPRWRLRVLLDV